MKEKKITFLGCGNMGTSLISGLVANGHPASSLCGVDPDENQRRRLADRHDIRIMATIAEGVPGADVIVLAVKPQTVPAALAEVKQALQTERPLVLSIAAGIRIATISKALGGACPVVRAMPNTPALLGARRNRPVRRSGRRRGPAPAGNAYHAGGRCCGLAG